MADSFWMPPRDEDRLLAQADARRAQFAGLVSRADAGMAYRAAELATRHPNASPGVVSVSAQEGLDDAQVADLASKDSPGGGFVSGLAGMVTGAVDAVYEQAIKPLVRGVFTVADTVAQEVVQRPLTAGLATAFGDADSFGQAYREYGDSAGANILQGDVEKYERDASGQVLTDERGAPVPIEGGSLGTGLFPGGGAQARSERERTLTINGHRANLGHALPTSRIAGSILGYDSTAYNVIAGVSQFATDVLADPLALVTGGGSTIARGLTKAGVVADGSRAQSLVRGGAMELRRASRRLDPAEATKILMESSGALTANGRNTVLVEKASDLIGKREILGKLAEADAYTIYQSFKRSPANQLDAGLLRALGNATDETRVSTVLLDAVQRGGVTQKGFYSGLQGMRRTVNNSKLAGTSARGRIDVDDLTDAVDKVDSFMRQARVGRDERASIFNRLIDLEDAPFDEKASGFFDVVEDAMASVTRQLDGEIDDITTATRLMRSDIEDLREYGFDMSGDPILTPLFKNKVDPGTGQEIATVGPQLTSELAKVGMELPDVTAIRRAAKRSIGQQKLYNYAGWKKGSDAARFATRDLFKPAAILRPAYVVRIGLEEQLRLAAAGYDSLFTHPLRFIQANVLARTEAGATGARARALQALPGGGGVDDVKMNRSLSGDNWEDVADTLNVVNRRAYNVMSNKTEGHVRRFTQMAKPQEASSRYIKAWQHELAQLSAAREARWLARNGGDLDGFLDWARNSAEGRATIGRIAKVSDEATDLLTSDDAVRQWGHSINQRLAAKTGGEVGEDGVIHALGDADLLDGIASGRMSGIQLSDQTHTANIHRTLQSKYGIAPQKIKVEIDEVGGVAAKQKNQARKAVDYLFDTFTGKPTTYLARYPAFRQSYIKRAGEMMGALTDDAARTAYARQIDSAFTLTKVEKADLATAVARNTGRRGFHADLTELDEVVKVKAASEVKDLLFDVTRRSNVQDAYEVALPFFDAWKEVTVTWGRLVKENPAFFIKAQQGYQSLRESGVVYANDHGDEVFAYPGGGMLGKFFGNDDMRLKLEGRVQGANLVAQGVGPGFGPMVQWAVGALMPTTREWEEVREWMAPFGTAGIESASDLANPGKLAESFIPAWARKGINAIQSGGIDEVQFNATAGDVMKVLAESGRYDPARPGDQQRLVDDARKGAKFILLLRSFTQATAITGASATWELGTEVDASTIPTDWDPEFDPDGKWHTIGTLASEFYRLAEFYDYDWQMAAGKFTEMFGIEPHYITQSKSRSLTESPVTTEGDYWMKDHEGFVGRHRAVAGYFVPPEEDPDLDYSVYRRQFDSGDRQSLTVEQQVQLANQTKARSMFYATKAQLDAIEGLSGAQRTAALSQVREAIEEQFPGWRDPVLGVQESLDSDAKIARLATAAEDPDVQDSPVAPALREYMAVREQLLGIARERGFQSLGNQASADLRAALDQIGQMISSRNPAFRGVWTQLLSREVEV